MYIVNTTFVVEPEVHNHWLDVIKKQYIPFLGKNGFADTVFTRLISDERPGHFTYSLQVYASDIPAYEKITGELMDEYLRIAEPAFAGQVLFFTSLMKKIL